MANRPTLPTRQNLLPTRERRSPVVIGGRSDGGTEPTPEEELPRFTRERKAVQGIVSGIFKGAIELGKDVFSGRFDLVRKLPGEMVNSFGRTVSGKNMREAISGGGTFAEALVEDLSNVALIGGATSIVTRKAAQTAKLAGNTERATKLLRAADKAHKVARPLHTTFDAARSGARSHVIRKLDESAELGLATGNPVKASQEASRILQSPIARFALKNDVREPLRQATVKAESTAAQFTHEIRRAVEAGEVPSDALIGADLALDTARRLDIELPFERVAGPDGIPRPAATEALEKMGTEMFERMKKQQRGGAIGDDVTDLDLSIDAYGRVVQGVVGRQAASQMWDTFRDTGLMRPWLDEFAPPGWETVDPAAITGQLPFQKNTVAGSQLDELLGQPTVPAALADDTVGQWIVPKGMAGEFKKWTHSFDMSGELVRLMDRPLNAFRAAVLFHSPRWLLNNLAGNAMLATLTGATLDPKAWRFAWEQARKDFRDVPALVTSRGVEREFRTAAREVGRRQSVPRALSLTENPLARAFRNANEFTDRFARTMVYRRELRRQASEVGNFDVDAMLDKVRQGRRLTKDELDVVTTAGNEARKALVDYGRLTPLERNIFRRIFPFYTWQSGILKTALTLPADHPLRFALIEEVSNHFGGFSQEERQEGMPEYLFGSIPVDFGGEDGEGGRLLTRGLNPFQDAFSLTTPDGLRSSINPVIDMAMSFVGMPGEFERPFRPLRIGGAGQTIPTIGPGELLGGTLENFLPQARLVSELAQQSGILPQREQLGLPPTRGIASEVMLGLGINVHSPERIAAAQEREARARSTQRTRDERLAGVSSKDKTLGIRVGASRRSPTVQAGQPLLPTRR